MTAATLIKDNILIEVVHLQFRGSVPYHDGEPNNVQADMVLAKSTSWLEGNRKWIQTLGRILSVGNFKDCPPQ